MIINIIQNQNAAGNVQGTDFTEQQIQEFFQGQPGYVGDGTKILDDQLNWIDPPENYLQ